MMMRLLLVFTLFANGTLHAAVYKPKVTAPFNEGRYSIKYFIDSDFAPSHKSCIESVLNEVSSFAPIDFILANEAYSYPDNLNMINFSVGSTKGMIPASEPYSSGETEITRSSDGTFAGYSWLMLVNFFLVIDQDCSPENLKAIRHELGHALGLEHEHQSPLITKQVRDEIVAATRRLWPRRNPMKILELDFVTLSSKEYLFDREIDLNSVMIYPRLVNGTMLKNVTFSEGDKRAINSLFPTDEAMRIEVATRAIR